MLMERDPNEDPWSDCALLCLDLHLLHKSNTISGCVKTPKQAILTSGRIYS